MSTNIRSKIDGLNKKADRLQDEIEDLEDQIGDLQVEIDEIEREVKSLEVAELDQASRCARMLMVVGEMPMGAMRLVLEEGAAGVGLSEWHEARLRSLEIEFAVGLAGLRNERCA